MASEFDILSSARSSKWETNTSGNLPSTSPKLPTKSIDTDKMDLFKEPHLDKDSGNMQNKTQSRRENLLPKNMPGAPEMSPNVVNAVLNSFKYGGLNMPPNFADAAGLPNVAYMNAFGFPGPFTQLPLPLSPNNIAVAGVMPNALQTLAARLSSVGAGYMSHMGCTSPTDLNSMLPFPTSLSPPYLGDFEPQMDYFSRLYATMSMINPIRPQNPPRSLRPTQNRKPYVATSQNDKSRKDLSSKTNGGQEGLSVNEKENGDQNGAGNTSNIMLQSSNKPPPTPHIKTKHMHEDQLKKRTPKLNKVKTAVVKDKKPQSSDKAANSGAGKSQSITECKAAEKTNGAGARTPRDLGTEEAAAILLHLSNATEADRLADDQQKSYQALVDKNQPIDYSSRSVEHKDGNMVDSVWSNFKSPNRRDTSFQGLKNKACSRAGSAEPFNVDNNGLHKGSEDGNSDLILSDNEYTYDLTSEEAKAQPGGFNFKKVICKKFTEELDPKDHPLQKTTFQKSRHNRLQLFDKPTQRSNKSPNHFKTKVTANKKCVKQFRSENNNQKLTAKPHSNAQSFSDLRAISKQLHPTTTRVTNRSGAKGLYRDAFGGSSDSMESLGNSENEDKEDDSESESEEGSSSEESDKASECVSDGEDDRSHSSSWSEDKTSLKRPFALSRPKFTLSNSAINLGGQTKMHQQDENKQQEQSKITIRSPTFKFSKAANLAKNKIAVETENSNKNEISVNSKHKIGLMPRVSANTLPKPRIAARVPKHVDINKRVFNMPELKFEDSSKSTLKTLFMQALNKTGECGGKPVGIQVDHKSLKAIGLANTDYFVHNNKKYILRRAIAKKKPVNKVKGCDSDSIDSNKPKKKTKFVIQELQLRKSNIGRNKNHVSNYVNNKSSNNDINLTSTLDKAITGQSDHHTVLKEDRSNTKGMKKIVTKRRKRSLDIIPLTVQCTDDSDIFSKVKLRHRNTLHNNVNTSETSTSTNTATTHSNATHRSRKKHWQHHMKRKFKKTGDLYMLSQLSYNKSIARAKKICQRRNVNIRKHIEPLSKDNNSPHCVRIMASASRPSYQIMRQIRATKENAHSDHTNVNIPPKTGGKSELSNVANSNKASNVDENNISDSQPCMTSLDDASNSCQQHAQDDVTTSGSVNDLKCSKNDEVEVVKVDSVCDFSVPVIAGATRLERVDKNHQNIDNGRVNKLKRKAYFQKSAYPNKMNESFKISTFFKSPPSLCIDALFGDLQTNYTVSKPGHENTFYKQTLRGWKCGINAVETKQQQQRDCWKRMTLQTYTGSK